MAEMAEMRNVLLKFEQDMMVKTDGTDLDAIERNTETLNRISTAFANIFDRGEKDELTSVQRRCTVELGRPRGAVDVGTDQVNIAGHLCRLAALEPDASLPQGKLSIQQQESALHNLKWIALNNLQTCNWLYQRPGFMQSCVNHVNAIATSTRQDADKSKTTPHVDILWRNEALMRLINTITRSLVTSHEEIASMIALPVSVMLTNASLTNCVRAQCVNSMLTLCSHKTVQVIQDTRVSTPLTKIALLNDYSLNSLGALLALAFMTLHAPSKATPHTGPSEGSSKGPVIRPLGPRDFDAVATPFLMSNLKEGLSRSLQGLDYPSNSRRYYSMSTMMMAMELICQHSIAATQLYRLKVLKVLRTGTHHESVTVRLKCEKCIDLLRSTVSASSSSSSILSTSISSLSSSMTSMGKSLRRKQSGPSTPGKRSTIKSVDSFDRLKDLGISSADNEEQDDGNDEPDSVTHPLPMFQESASPHSLFSSASPVSRDSTTFSASPTGIGPVPTSSPPQTGTDDVSFPPLNPRRSSGPPSDSKSPEIGKRIGPIASTSPLSSRRPGNLLYISPLIGRRAVPENDEDDDDDGNIEGESGIPSPISIASGMSESHLR